ncbi:3TM-type holin [Spirochaeta cellobiosiphila]|uniref:3TM-type holin n=1 Tax=Spirochaeta cellobiosiphila TaxID=504483 RepID=UPI0003FA42CF|nr:3TM-type holin [Spirochaeta cellobiosiphila]
MNVLDAIGGLFQPACDLIDDIHTSGEEKLTLQNQLESIKMGIQSQMLSYEAEVLKAQRDVLVAEAQGQSWIQRNWRPCLMMVIIAIIGNNYVLLPYLSLVLGKAPKMEMPPELFNLLSIGVGGYVVGRSGEKIALNLKGVRDGK